MKIPEIEEITINEWKQWEEKNRIELAQWEIKERHRREQLEKTQALTTLKLKELIEKEKPEIAKELLEAIENPQQKTEESGWVLPYQDIDLIQEKAGFFWLGERQINKKVKSPKSILVRIKNKIKSFFKKP